jgi:hypothetical protein
MTQTGSVSSGEIYNATVVTATGKVYSGEILNHKRGGIRIASLVNQGSGDLSCTYTLESWDGELNDWIPEPRAIFDAHPAGVAIKTVDTFADLQAEKYRVGIDPTGGTSGPVKMSVSEQTEE